MIINGARADICGTLRIYDTETCARLVEQIGMKARDAEVALDVVEADLAAGRKAHAVQRAALRRDLNYAIRRARTVQRRRGGALHDLHAFNVGGIQVRNARGKNDAIDDVERILTAAGCVE